MMSYKKTINYSLIIILLSFPTTFNIFFIFDGNKAYNEPSINNKRPIAMMSSFIELFIVY